MPSTTARMATKDVKSPAPRARRRGPGGSWDADEVAAHLMSCRDQIVRGLGHKSPWDGLDDETLASCYGHGAAVIAKVASSGQRPEWRTTKDLERAQVAAYRHQALDHWKRINTQSRQGDRFTVVFDPERHASGDAPMDRLFEQPDLMAIERDLLAELVDDELRSFWSLVLRERHTFKSAGDRLGLTRAMVMAHTRAGRAAFNVYLERRGTGQLCVERSMDVRAHRAGKADPVRAERAEAHLESCYACALVHEPSTSAFQRGLLGLAPTGLILRFLFRSGEGPASPVLRTALESSSGSRMVATGLAAVAVAGSGVGIQAARDAPAKPPEPSREIASVGQAPATHAVTAAAVTIRTPASPPPIVEPIGIERSPSGPRPQRTKRPTRKPEPPPVKRAAPAEPAPSSVSPPPGEFGFEQPSSPPPPPPPAPAAPPPASPPPTAAPTPSALAPGEFDLP